MDNRKVTIPRSTLVDLLDYLEEFKDAAMNSYYATDVGLQQSSEDSDQLINDLREKCK